MRINKETHLCPYYNRIVQGFPSIAAVFLLVLMETALKGALIFSPPKSFERRYSGSVDEEELVVLVN